MRFVLIGVGSVGDVMPQLVLAAELNARGHRTLVIGLAPYASLATSLGVDYEAVPADTTALWPNGALRRRLALAQPGIMFATMLGRFAASAPDVNDVLFRVVRSGDVIVTGIVTAGAARLLAKEVGATVVPVLFAPLLPATSAKSSALAPALGGPAVSLVGSTIMWSLSEQLAAAHTGDMARRLNRRRVRPMDAGAVLMATSPTISPPSTRWPGRVRQTGWIAARSGTDTAPEVGGLSDFLEADAPPVLMTFGSCPAVSPTRDVELFLDAAGRAGVRVLLQTTALPSGGISDRAYNAPGVPHSWLMPRVGSVVHHGGAGTTHAALAAGRPAVVVPHLGDQAYYARRVHALGTGPRGVPRWRLTAAILARKLRILSTGESASRFARAAAVVAGHLGTEDGCTAAAATLEDLSGA